MFNHTKPKITVVDWRPHSSISISYPFMWKPKIYNVWMPQLSYSNVVGEGLVSCGLRVKAGPLKGFSDLRGFSSSAHWWGLLLLVSDKTQSCYWFSLLVPANLSAQMSATPATLCFPSMDLRNLPKVYKLNLITISRCKAPIVCVLKFSITLHFCWFAPHGKFKNNAIWMKGKNSERKWRIRY